MRDKRFTPGSGQASDAARAARAADNRRHAGQSPKSPFAGDPETVFAANPEGEVVAIVMPRVLTPGRAKFADFLGACTTFVMSAVAVALVAAIADRPHFYVWPLAVVAPWPFLALYEFAWRRALRKSTALVFTTDRFIVRHGDGNTDSFDRHEPHGFRLEGRHEAAIREAEDHEQAVERARMRGRIIRKRKYQRDTFHLIFKYRSSEWFVMEIMGLTEARRVLGRVKDVDDEMDRIAAMGSAPESGPRSEWDDMPGKIPEKV